MATARDSLLGFTGPKKEWGKNSTAEKWGMGVDILDFDTHSLPFQF